MLYINSFKTIVVSSTDKTKEEIYSKLIKEDGNPDRLELEKKEYTILNEQGREVEFSDIEADDVLSVQESFNKKLVKIYISKAKKSGNFGGVDADAGEILTADGASYQITKGFTTHLASKMALSSDLTYEEKVKEVFNSFSYRDFYTFYIDMFGRLAYTEQMSTWEYGYVIKAGNNGRSSLNDSFVINVYNDKIGVKDLKLAEKLNIFDELGNPAKRFKDDEAVAVINAHCEKYKYNRMIRFKRNTSDEITEIELPLLASVEKTTIVGDRLCLLENLGADDGAFKAFYDHSTFNNRFLTTADTKLVSPPIENIGDDYATVTNSTLRSDVSYNLIPYTTKPMSFTADYVVMPEYEAYVAAEHEAYNFMIVDKVKENYNKELEEKLYVVSGYEFVSWAPVTSNYVTYYVKEKDANTVVNKIHDLKGNEKKLSNGDIIRLTLSKRHKDKSYIERATLYFDADVPDTVYGGKGMLTSISGAKVSEGNPSRVLRNNDTITANNVVPAYETISVYNPLQADAVRLTSVGIGYVYSRNGNRLVFTTQPLRTQPYQSLANGDYYTLAGGSYSPTGNPQFIYRKTGDSVKVEQATIDQIKTYETHGSACSKVLWFAYYDIRFVVYFEE